MWNNIIIWSSLVMTGAAVAVVVYRKVMMWSWKTGSSRRSVPLGSLGWPFVGETLHFISSAYSDTPESFTLKRRRMYGKVFKSHLFGSRTIVSTDAEVSRLIVQSDGGTFVPAYPKSLMELMGNSSILLINGALHRRLHALIAAFLKSPSLKAQISSDIHHSLTQSMPTWEQHSPLYIQDQAKTIAFRVLVKALISLDGGDEMEQLKEHFQEFIAGLMSLPLNFPGTQLYRSLQAKKKMVKLINGIIQKKRHCKNMCSNNNKPMKDVADALLSDTCEDLTDELISENIIDLMIPGEDSVPLLMTLAIKFLSDSPLALQQFTKENLKLKMHKEKQGEALCWKDYLSSLPFTQAVITETLRLGNIIIGVMRKAMRDVVIKGHFIPKGWSVFAHFRSVHLDDSLYDFPYDFDPWRWQGQEVIGGGSCIFTPFGGGQRLCPGLDLARLETSVFLHHFVTQFSWEAEEDSIINFPTVRMKRRMPVWVKRRTQTT